MAAGQLAVPLLRPVSGGFIEASGTDLYARSRARLDTALEDWRTTDAGLVVHSLGRPSTEQALRPIPQPGRSEPAVGSRHPGLEDSNGSR